MLSEVEAAELRAELGSLRDALQGAIDSSREAARPVDLDEPIGRVSRIDAIQQREMVQANRQAIRARMQQVRSALQRFDEGEYGDCLSCGEEVGFARLKARPETPLCIGCQSRREGGT